jgi:hypothetical protein
MTGDNTDCRKDVRNAAALEGTVMVARRKCGIDVRIHDMSERGAKLSISGDPKLPMLFELLVVEQNTIYPARICWKRQEFVGIEFVGRSYPGSLV